MSESVRGPLPRIPLGIDNVRVVSKEPRGFRVAQYPDGSKRVQGSYLWSEGGKWGFEWKDLPMVKVDALGNEIK